MTGFSTVQQAVLELLKKGLFKSATDFDFSVLSDEEWEAVASEIRAQSIDIVCFDATDSLNIPSHVSSELLLRAANLLAGNLKIQTAQEQLTNLLEKNSIPYVILKGAASSYFYDNRQNRISGDIDFLVPTNYVAETEQLLLENGAVCHEEHNENHVGFRFMNVEVELHHSVAGIPKNEFGEVYKEYFTQICNRRVYDESGFFKPDAPMHGVVILLHTFHHVMSYGIGLRHICDWACYVNKTHTEPYWKEELLPLFKEAGMLKFVYIVTNVVVKYLGVPCPDWLEEVSESVSDNFILEIFNGGNFGRKIKRENATGIMTVKDSEKSTFKRKVKAMLHALNSTNHRLYPILDKLPWLYPFIMLWRMLRYMVLMLCGKRASLTRAYKYADSRSRQFEEFELFQTEE